MPIWRAGSRPSDGRFRYSGCPESNGVSAEWTWTVPSDGSLGDYSIRTALPGVDAAGSGQRPVDAEWLKQIGGTFLVAAYRRPDFRVTTTLAARTS